MIPKAFARTARPLAPKVAHIAIWLLIAAPALYQLGLLVTAISGPLAARALDSPAPAR